MDKAKHSLIALQIKTLRKKEGITQRELAEKTGLSKSAIISYENGVREPNSKAMAALESYFHVTGEYLRGETYSSDSQYIWQNPEVMEAVAESFPSLINRLLDTVLHNSEAEQKMLFDILVELCHMASLKNASPEFREASFLLIEETFTRTTRFVDFLNRSMSSEFEQNRIEKYIQSCAGDYEKSLVKFQNLLKDFQ